MKSTAADKSDTSSLPPAAGAGSGSSGSGLVGFLTGKVGRYLVVSGINVCFHQVLLQIALRTTEWPGEWCNAFAAMVAAIPAFLMSKYWVWQVKGKADLRSEVLPFWVIAIAGLVASSVMAGVAERQFESDLAVSVASLIGYLLVWMAKFVVLNVLFARSEQRQAAADGS